MKRYLAIGIDDDDNLFVWSEEFESDQKDDKRRDAAIEVLKAKMPDAVLCRVLIVKDDNVIDDFDFTE